MFSITQHDASHPSPTSTRKRRALVSSLEPLESRIAPAIITVGTLDDAGTGSLRQAVLDANAHAGADTIKFILPLSGVITLTSGELLVTDTLTVLGGNKITISGDNAGRIF